MVAEEWICEFAVTSRCRIHLLRGLVVVFAGYGLFVAATWARVVVVIVAAVAGMVAGTQLMPYYSVWERYSSRTRLRRSGKSRFTAGT